MELTYAPESERLAHETAAPRRPRSEASRTPRPPALDVAVAAPVRPNGGSHAAGIAVVVAAHVVIGYALVSGLASKVVDAVRAPVEVNLIEAVKPPPPPPEPPRQIAKAPPKLAPPLPVYVPPPEVQVAALAEPVVAVVSQQPQVDAKPVPAPVAAPPAPPVRAEPVAIGVVCPTLVRPVLPRRAEQEGLSGSVRAQATIRGGKVIQVDILASKPRGLFDAAVRTAMLQYGCQATAGVDVVATQNFEFKAGE